MKLASTLLLLLILPIVAAARTIEVRSGGTYTNIQGAAAAASPGDTILFREGVYPGGQSVSGLQGTSSAWITIMAEPGREVILRGGSNAWQLSDPAYLRIIGFVLEGQTGNGLNIDDAGSFDTPAHHIVIERCVWRGIDATGNNDLLKLSGIDSFEVRNCEFRDGAAGGSMIDMVGCHNGLFTQNHFEGGGSNCIQAKGGTQYIVIERNTFIDGGLRALNIGGSTGLEFFRPQGVNFESANIYVYSNIFVGSDAPIAYVGTVNSEVVNNTIYLPRRWAIRILQETTGASFLQCGDNTFRNNIVVVGSAAANPTINIGPNTRPQTFTFSNNLWYNVDNASWNGPNLPATESNGIIGRDPMLSSPPTDMRLRSGSPAIGAGFPSSRPVRDYLGGLFANLRSIGAVEGGAPTTSVERMPATGASLAITAPDGADHALARFTLPSGGRVELAVYDMHGKRIWDRAENREAGEGWMAVPVGELPAGVYFFMLRCEEVSLVRPVMVR